jgi:pyrroloquinoline quinone biosynthesis protein B
MLKLLILYVSFFAVLALTGCQNAAEPPVQSSAVKDLPDQFLVVLGIAQDAGYPQAGCRNTCCNMYWEGKEPKKHVTSLALIDRKTRQYWLLEATPDIAVQLNKVQEYTGTVSPVGIFITHAHIGHYTGLMQLGREVMGTKNIPVWVMPRMDSFLRNNGPWSQLVTLQNIRLQRLKADSAVQLSPSLTITPVIVPHRDEFSETAGFIIQSKKKKVLFIPDIDKWEKWERDIVEQINETDLALLDGTFYANGELPGRDMSEVPHPFVEESLQKFSSLSSAAKSKILFIHFNHTNPLLKTKSPEKDKVKTAGFGVAEEGMVIGM